MTPHLRSRIEFIHQQLIASGEADGGWFELQIDDERKLYYDIVTYFEIQGWQFYTIENEHGLCHTCLRGY